MTSGWRNIPAIFPFLVPTKARFWLNLKQHWHFPWSVKICLVCVGCLGDCSVVTYLQMWSHCPRGSWSHQRIWLCGYLASHEKHPEGDRSCRCWICVSLGITCQGQERWYWWLCVSSWVCRTEASPQTAHLLKILGSFEGFWVLFPFRPRHVRFSSLQEIKIMVWVSVEFKTIH